MIQSGLICALVWILMQGTDRLLGWQTLQRPIVTATVTGFLLGDIRTGMIMAASLEAIFMGISAIGGSIPSDACASMRRSFMIMEPLGESCALLL